MRETVKIRALPCVGGGPLDGSIVDPWTATTVFRDGRYFPSVRGRTVYAMRWVDRDALVRLRALVDHALQRRRDA